MRSLTAGLLLIATLAGAARAQNPQTREGFWISFGFGYGSLGCNDCNDDNRANGAAAYLRMGGTVSQQLLIGGEASGWSKEEGNATWSIANVGPVLMFYPSANGGFYLKGGIGIGSASVEVPPHKYEENGVGVTFGLGWDARVGRGFALTPFLEFVSVSTDHVSVNSVGIGLGFTWP